MNILSRGYHVLTGYSYPNVKLNKECIIHPSADYTEYDLFCLNNRLRLFVEKNIPPPNDPSSEATSARYTLEYLSIPLKDRYYIGIAIVDAGKFVELENKYIRMLEKAVDEITSVNPTHCVLFSFDTVIYLDNAMCMQSIPLWWMRMILPRIPIDPSLNSFMEKGNLYADFGGISTFNVLYREVAEEIEKRLIDYYTKGVIMCDEKFAEKWDLVKFENKLYLPAWEDTRFAPDRVKFLFGRMIGDILPSNITGKTLSEIRKSAKKHV